MVEETLTPIRAVLARDVVANLLASAWTAIMSIAFVPVYIHFIGIEAYGLIGFVASFQAILALLDLGLGPAATREFARSGANSGVGPSRDLLRTLEIAYWLGAAIVLLLSIAIAPYLSAHWLRASGIASDQIELAVIVLGASFGARWPYVLYCATLGGLHRQVSLNIMRVAVETIRNAGSVAVLWLVSGTLSAFLYWQLLSSILASIVAAQLAWKAVGAGSAPRFRWDELKRIARFALPLSAIAITVVILTQSDKIVLSRILDLKSLGYYTLASSVAVALGQLVTPIFAVCYPRLSLAVAAHDSAEAERIYHRGSQLVSVLILPFGLVLAVLSNDILELWTRNRDIAREAHPMLSVLAIGSVLNGLMGIPYALQLAHGWTRLTLYGNVIAIICLVPGMVLLARNYGALGASFMWLMLNIGYILVSLQIMHRYILPGQQRRWLREDIAGPLASSAVVVAIGYFLMSACSSDIGRWAVIGGSVFGAVLASTLSVGALRRYFVRLVRS